MAKTVEIDLKTQDAEGVKAAREWVFATDEALAAHMIAEPWADAGMKPAGADLKLDGKKVTAIKKGKA